MMGACDNAQAASMSAGEQATRPVAAAAQAAGNVQIKEFICIRCPLGCLLTVAVEGGEVTDVAGNTCARGKRYAAQEATHPMRTVTALVDVEGSAMPLSCKTARPIPKEQIFDCLATLRGLELHRPIAIGDVVYANVCGTGIDVVATKDID